jgi:hypothetical protein
MESLADAYWYEGKHTEAEDEFGLIHGKFGSLWGTTPEVTSTSMPLTKPLEPGYNPEKTMLRKILGVVPRSSDIGHSAGGTCGGSSTLDLVRTHAYRCGHQLSESPVKIGVLRDCALPCGSVLAGLEWIKRALLCQLSYAPTFLTIYHNGTCVLHSREQQRNRSGD